MSEKSTRDHIVDAADRLFYTAGFDHTSFTHIADTVQISRGNFYHHFKTKDDILQAVIAARLQATQAMLAQWAANSPDPAERIRSFIRILIVNRLDIAQYGCPVGTLCTELAKLNHAAKAEANQVLTLFRTWLAEQFTLAGCGERADALAVHLLARSQGAATIVNAFGDEAFALSEVRHMRDWLDACLANPGRAAGVAPAKP